MPILERVRWPSEQHRRQYIEYLRHEIINTQGDRAPLDRKWKEEIEQWRAAVPRAQKDFPWPGASNVVFPLTAMHHDPVYADMMQTLHAMPEYWNVMATRPDRVPHANPMTEIFRAIEERFINMRAVNGRALMDNNILGTAIYKSHWLHERKKVRDYVDEGGVRKIGTRVKVRSHPLVEPVHLQHFYIPADAWHIDPDAPVGGARWVAQEHYMTPAQLRARADAESPHLPGYNREAVDMVVKYEQMIENPVDDKIRLQEQYTPWYERKIQVFEVWARYDVDGDGVEEDIFTMVHLPTGAELRTLYNPFLHGRRPFFRTRYLPSFGFYGFGLAEADKWAQTTATRLINGIVDNVMVANTRMYSAPLGSNIQPGEPIYPGKIWLHAPGEKVEAMAMGEVYPSIFQSLANMLQYAELRTGVNEVRQGNLTGLPNRTPATSLLSMLQEGNKRFDMILADFRDTHDQIGMQVLQNFTQFYAETPERWSTFCRAVLGEEDAALVIEALSMSVHDVEDSFGVRVAASSALVNKEAEKQQFVGLLQLLGDIYGKLVETASVLQQVPPGSPVYETAAAAYACGVELTGRLLEKFDIQNPRAHLGNLQAIAGALQAQAQGMNPAMAPGMMPEPMGGAPPVPFGTAAPLLGPGGVAPLLGL